MEEFDSLEFSSTPIQNAKSYKSGDIKGQYYSLRDGKSSFSISNDDISIPSKANKIPSKVANIFLNKPLDVKAI